MENKNEQYIVNVSDNTNRNIAKLIKLSKSIIKKYNENGLQLEKEIYEKLDKVSSLVTYYFILVNKKNKGLEDMLSDSESIKHLFIYYGEMRVLLDLVLKNKEV